MSIIKVIELIAQSEKGWEDAANNALQEAKKTVKNIESIYIKDMKAIVKDGEIDTYRVNVKVSFSVGD